jgi:hypothetical protein
MGLEERLITQYDAKQQLIIPFSTVAEAPPNAVVLSDFAHADTSGSAIDPLDIPYPTTLAPGDFLVCFVGGRSSDWTTPTGWTNIYKQSFGGNAEVNISYKIADGFETGTISVPQGFSRTTHGGCLALQGVKTSNPIDDVQTIAEYDDTPDSPAATASADGAFVIRCYGKRVSTPTWPEDTLYPPTAVGIWDQHVSDSACGIAYEPGYSAGVVDAVSWGPRTGQTNAHIAVTIVLNRL